MQKLFLALLLLSTSVLSASDSLMTVERQAVIHTIETLFDAMREGDSTKLRSTFDANASLMTTYMGKDGKAKVHVGKVDEFVTQVGTPHEAVYDERIWSYEVQIDGLMATAWTEYTFFLGDKMSHCGVNAFQLFKSSEGWKVINITDTRRKEGCQTEAVDDTQVVNELMDAWHRAAATADEDVFFGSMTEQGIYIGTDASERWLRDDMREWSKKYFERESAWDFTARDREVYFSASGREAWFEESLDTWMGVCRASGVLTKTAKGWKIAHYHLSVTVPNEKIKAFIELVEKK